MFLKISQNSQEITCVRVSGLQLYEKRDSNTGIFLLILRKFHVRTLFTNCLLLKVEIKLVSCILLINVRTITIISGVATDALANSIMTNTTISTWIDMTFILNYNKNEKLFYSSRKSLSLKSRTLSTKK